MIESARRVLLTGATGFVGRALLPRLRAAGWRVRALSRRPPVGDEATRDAGVEWVTGDVGHPGSLDRALAGCEAAFYLVHGMGEGRDFHTREHQAAERFATAAGRAELRRVVYLGGIVPATGGSEHLASRRDVGEALRAGPVSTLELRASMIVGHGSLSWLIVRDLAARLPVMVLPSWLRSRTQPVAIDDVVVALLRAVDLPDASSGCYDLPGPEILSGRQILDATAAALGLYPAWKVELPVLTPRLSSLWVRFVTRADWTVARAVVVGLAEDLLARDASFWARIDHPRRLDFAEAARRALQAEGPLPLQRGAWAAVERARRIERRRTRA